MFLYLNAWRCGKYIITLPFQFGWSNYKVYITMNVVSKTCDESRFGLYVSPEVKVVLFQFEGVLCGSVTGSGHDDFTVGGEYDL